MGVKFKDKKKLLSNDYEKIMIREISRGNYNVSLNGEKSIPNSIKISNTLYERLKEIDDEEKIKMIIDNYLDYVKIDYISCGEFIARYEESFIIAKGNRELDIQLYNKQFSDVPKKLLNRYIQDRVSFCNNNDDISSYQFQYSRMSTSYEMVDTACGESIEFRFLGEGGKLGNFEKVFLRQFLYEKLYNSGEEANISDSMAYFPAFNNEIYFGTCLICGDFRVRLFDNYGDIAQEVRNVVNNYNEERMVAKSKQLKLEGF